MKKTIMLSLIVTSLVTGANTVDNLKINQQNRITSSSKIDNAIVNQGNIEVIGASNVEDVTIFQKGSQGGNIIENSDIIGNINQKPIISQGFTKIKNAKVKDLTLQSINEIINVNSIHGNSKIEQASFIITDSNATDSNGHAIDIDSLNSIKGSSTTSNMDVNGTEIKQAVVVVTNGAEVDNLSLKYDNDILESDIDSVEIYQGTLDVNSSEVNELYVEISGGNNKAIQLINATDITGGSVHQNSIHISNNAYVNVMKVYTTNKIENSTSTDSTISQSEITIK